MFHGSSAPLLISSTNWISRPWSRPPSKQSFRSSLPSRPARLLILLHLNVTRRPQLHRQARRLGIPFNPSLRPAPAVKPGRQSRRWNAGGPAGLATLEARNAAARQAQLPQRPQRLRLQDPAPLRAGPGSGGTTPRSGQPDNDIIFLCEDDEDDTNEDSVNQSIQFIRPTGDTNEA
jgi:hypothetical protein